MTEKEDRLSALGEVLPKYSSEQFATLVPKGMLGLSDSQMRTVQFAFWFCYIVEKNLTDVLQEAINKTKEMLGETQPEVDKYLREKYGIKFEVVDEDHPKYDACSIVFNHRIEIVENMRGKDAHTDFLRKMKMIRNDLSHGRILELSYNEESLFEDTTKAELVRDYISGMLNFEERGEGGALQDQTPEERARVDALWEEFQKRQQKNN